MSDQQIDFIKELREITGASLADIKEAIEQSGYDKNKALQILKRKGALIAQKKSIRETKEGIIETYIHANRRIGVLVELRCETDFVAKNSEFLKLARELALQIAATKPRYLRPEDIPEEVKAEERKIFEEELEGTDKPVKIKNEIIEGKLQKRWSEICLLKQPYIRNEDITVEELITESIAKLGEKIEIGQFVRFEL